MKNIIISFIILTLVLISCSEQKIDTSKKLISNKFPEETKTSSNRWDFYLKNDTYGVNLIKYMINKNKELNWDEFQEFYITYNNEPEKYIDEVNDFSSTDIAKKIYFNISCDSNYKLDIANSNFIENISSTLKIMQRSMEYESKNTAENFTLQIDKLGWIISGSSNHSDTNIQMGTSFMTNKYFNLYHGYGY